jgi:hypothetical protein
MNNRSLLAGVTAAAVVAWCTPASLAPHVEARGLDVGQAWRDCAPAKLVTLPDAGHRLHTPVLNVVQDGEGRFFARSLNSGYVVVFDRTGRFTSAVKAGIEAPRIILMLRSGPGASVMAWLVPGGPAFRIGSDLQFTPWGGNVPHLPEIIRSDGSMIVAQQIRTPEHAGYPIHVVDRDGRVVRSFGADVAEYRSDLSLLLDRIVAPASGGMIWAAPRGRYSLERWDPATGRRLSRVPIQSSWFVESAAPRRDDSTRPTALFTALWERDGLVWALVRDVSPTWKPPVKVEQPWSVQAGNADHDWVLEVVEPASGKVLASRRVDFALSHVPPQGLLVSYALTPSGGAAGVDVWQPELKRKE